MSPLDNGAIVLYQGWQDIQRQIRNAETENL